MARRRAGASCWCSTPTCSWSCSSPSVFGLFVGAHAGADRDHGDRAAGAGHLLHVSGAGDRRDRRRDRHGDLRRRHPGRAGAHSGHARVRRLCRGLLSDDRARARRELVLGACLVFSVDRRDVRLAGAGGRGPGIAEFALNFSSFEYFWLALLGLSCAVFISTGSPIKGIVSSCSACSSPPSASTRRPGTRASLSAMSS